MKIKTATTIFDALTSEARLSIFRQLVKYAPDGLVAGEVTRMLGIPKTNLSFHLKSLVHSGLASMEREGRNTRYRANIPLMLEIIAYLTDKCCSGNSGLTGISATKARTRRNLCPTVKTTSNNKGKL